MNTPHLNTSLVCVAFIFPFLFSTCLISAEIPQDQRITPSHTGTIADIAMLHAALVVHFEYSNTPKQVGSRWSDVESISRYWDPSIMRNAPTVDRWGNPFLVRLAWDEPILLSCGPNGTVDDEDSLAQFLSASFFDRYGQIDLAGDDLLFYEGTLIKGPKSTEDHWKRTMADLRTLATAAAMYEIDYEKLVYEQHTLSDVSVLSTLLSPMYLKGVPVVDSWGNPFLVIASIEHIMFISFGADGEPDLNYENVELSDTSIHNPDFTNPDTDVLHFEGIFVSFPAGMGVN